MEIVYFNLFCGLFNNELQKMGWVIKKENGRWVELFSTCSKKQPKIVGDSNKLNERTL